MNVELHPIKTNDYKDDEITRVVMKHRNKGEYHTGFRDGRDVTVCAVLEIIDRTIYCANLSGGIHANLRMSGTLLEVRDAVLALKGEQE